MNVFVQKLNIFGITHKKQNDKEFLVQTPSNFLIEFLVFCILVNLRINKLSAAKDLLNLKVLAIRNNDILKMLSKLRWKYGIHR